MHFNKGETIALFILVGLICISLFFAVIPPPVGQKQERADQAYSEEDAHYTPEEYQAVELSISRRDLFAQQTMAVGTLALFALTLVSIVVVVWSSNKALRETKRSVETYIGREIGYLTFEGCERTPPMGVGMHEHVWIRMLNNGPSVVHLIGFDGGFQCVKKESEADASPLDANAINRIISVGQRFGTEGNDQNADALARPLAIPLEVMKRFAEQRGMLIMTLDFTYDSPFGVFVKRISVLINDPDDPHQLFYGDLRYNLPIAQVPRHGAQNENHQPGKRVLVKGRPWGRRQQGS